MGIPPYERTRGCSVSCVNPPVSLREPAPSPLSVMLRMTSLPAGESLALYTRGPLVRGNARGAGQSKEIFALVLSGIQNVITDGNPAKWVGGVSKKGRGTGGFVKITRGKSDGLIRF